MITVVSKPCVKEIHEIDIDGLPLQKYIDDEPMMMMRLSRQQAVKQGDVLKPRVLRSVWFNKQKKNIVNFQCCLLHGEMRKLIY